MKNLLGITLSVSDTTSLAITDERMTPWLNKYGRSVVAICNVSPDQVATVRGGQLDRKETPTSEADLYVSMIRDLAKQHDCDNLLIAHQEHIDSETLKEIYRALISEGFTCIDAGMLDHNPISL